VSHSWSPIVKDGEVWQVVSAVNDITWRKNAETALQRSLRELEQWEQQSQDMEERLENTKAMQWR